MSIKYYIYSLHGLLTQGKKGREILILMELIILSGGIHQSNRIVQNRENEQCYSRSHVCLTGSAPRMT